MEILKNTFSLGIYTFECVEQGTYNNNKYSKGYHRKYGGVWEKEKAFIIINKNNQFFKKVEVDNFKGDLIVKIIKALDLIPNSNIPLYIRINSAYDAILIKSIRGYKIYKRTILDQFYDYVIVSPDKLTYHDENLKNLFIGLKEKIKTAALKSENKLVNYKILRSLGFCKSGITEVANYLNLDTRKNYNISEIEDIFKNNNLTELSQFKKDFLIFCNYYNINTDILKGLD